ncbi:toMV resistant protein Tm-2 netted virescent-like [Lycium ferocissimum]|uniref:toMV resistant protein Tm-2 netted virescent-like n=1 Tax=Lycium ferocissimum TaxID=112874 RepID=UPI00281590BD|nr:toMV resistant protein Tm-2 netted virescent-like [Lycium ferocissimum]
MGAAFALQSGQKVISLLFSVVLDTSCYPSQDSSDLYDEDTVKNTGHIEEAIKWILRYLKGSSNVILIEGDQLRATSLLLQEFSSTEASGWRTVGKSRATSMYKVLVSVSCFLHGVSSRRLRDIGLNDVHMEARNSSQGGDCEFEKIFKETANRRNDDIVRALVEQIREAAEEAEDAIDTYMVKSLRQQQQQNFIENIYHGAGHIGTINKVVKKIGRIKKRIEDIHRNREQLGIDLSENVDDSQLIAELRRRRIEVEEVDVVGFNHYAQQLVHLLLDERKFDVISINGMGGLGKTTLALKVFKDPQLRHNFSGLAWHYGSQEYSIRDLVLDLLAQVNDWENLRACFPDDRNGSKILLTSRNIDVATYASSTQPFHLPPMEEAESWKLFSGRVFQGRNFPEDMVELGRRMCKDCNGLPLAILTLAGVLLTKKTLRSWSNIVEHVNWHLVKDPTRCLDILSLSYGDLPPHLKSCFLYFGVYPEGFTIPAKQIMQLWIAEGFVQNENYRTMEDLAEDYLEELIARSLVQVVSRARDGGVKTC